MASNKTVFFIIGILLVILGIFMLVPYLVQIIYQEKNLIELTEKEIQIILFLNKEKNSQNISILEKEIWGYASRLETHTVETHIYRLRKKFKESFNDDNFIINFDNGYKI